MELTLEERVAALERKLLAREAAEEPTEYYTSKYSGEQNDPLLDKVLANEGCRTKCSSRQI